MTPYPGTPIVTSNSNLPTTSEKKITDAISAFADLATRPSYLAAHANDLFDSNDYKGVVQNHFQGMVTTHTRKQWFKDFKEIVVIVLIAIALLVLGLVFDIELSSDREQWALLFAGLLCGHFIWPQTPVKA